MIGIKRFTQGNQRWTVTALTFGGLAAGCAIAVLLLVVLVRPSSETNAGEPESDAAVLESIEGTELSRVILSEQAAERLGIETALVADAEVESAGGEKTLRSVIPNSAVLYDVNGEPYVYTSPDPLTFVRAPITIDYIDGDVAVLSDGPPSGTAIVTVGSAELFGAEFEFEED
jgi:hypothetical protein